MGDIRIGIGVWTFAPWRGLFYPEGLRQKDELAYAAARLSSIEINGTYYGRQSPKSFASWAAAVPDGFQFAVKASRYCTNRRVLAEAEESIERFVDQGISELGDRLGPILWQFAATKAFDPADMAAFVALLPASVAGLPLRHALEVRHESFRDDAFIALCKAANIAIVLADHETYPLIEADTADFTYARLMRSVAEEPAGYVPDALELWATRAQQWSDRGDTYAYVISGAKERAPAAAQALIARTGGLQSR